jgi:hypothetical protein
VCRDGAKEGVFVVHGRLKRVGNGHASISDASSSLRRDTSSPQIALGKGVPFLALAQVRGASYCSGWGKNRDAGAQNGAG